MNQKKLRVVMTDDEIKKVIKLEGREAPPQYIKENFSTLVLKSSKECREIYLKQARSEKVALLNIQFAPNLGTVVRTACLWGFGEILTFGRRQYDKRLAVGLNNYIPIQHYPAMNDTELDIDYVISVLTKYSVNHTIVFIELHHRSISLFEMNEKIKASTKPPLFILGDEHVGISSKIIDAFNDALIVQIPQPGIGRSHNVAIAFASVVAVYFAGQN